MNKKIKADLKLIKEFNDLKRQYDELKLSYELDISARNLVEKKILNRSELLSALNQYSIELGEQDSSNVLKYLVFKFKELFSVRGVWISIYDEARSELVVETSTATEIENAQILKCLGQPLMKHHTYIDEEKYRIMVDIGIWAFSSLHEISFGQIPEKVSKTLERIFNVGWFHGIALVDKGSLYGTLIIAGYKGQEVFDPEILKIFAELTSNILRRKETETRLVLSEDKFRRAFITSPDSININRMDSGMYVSINKGFTKITGYTEEDVLGKTSLELDIWADPSDRDRLVKGLIENGEVGNLETNFRLKNGRIITAIMSATIIDLNGIPHILSITRDLTERKKMELELRDSETRLLKSKAQYDDLVAKIPVGIYLLHTYPDGLFALDYVSPRMAEMLGTSVTELMSDAKIIYKKIHPNDRKAFAKLNQDGIIYHKPFNWSGRVLHKRKIKWLNISSVPEPQKNGDILWHGIIVDITDRIKAENSLIESERLLRESQNVARLGSFVWDIPSNLWKSSGILDEIFGIDEMFIRSFEGWISIIHPDFREEMTNYVISDILTKHNKFDKEYQIIRKNDGQIRWVHGLSELEFDKNRRPLKLIGTIIDVTDRRNIDDEIKKLNVKLEERVNERTSQLEDANRELQAFAYSVSHDLRAPLRAIDGFSKFVMEDYSEKLDEEGKRLLELIRSNTRKMDKLITDILSLSRVSRGEHKISKIDMTKMAFSMFHESCSSDNPNKVNFIIENIPDIYADSAYIKQVWLNLISNAIKFSSLIENPEVMVGGYAKDGFNIYYVKDNGAGFNPEYSHKLFGVFQRLHRSEEFEGTGVGLAIVQRIIHRHGGTVWAEGKEGEGAIFYFSLPNTN